MSVPRLKMEAGGRDEDVRDDRPSGGLLHRTRHLSGWGRHLTGYTCPRCGASCQGKDQGARRAARDRHDMWHRDDDQAWDEWTEELESLTARIVKLEGQMELMTELLGPALARLMEEREPA